MRKEGNRKNKNERNNKKEQWKRKDKKQQVENDLAEGRDKSRSSRRRR